MMENFLEQLMTFIFPACCLHCRQLTYRNLSLCESCEQQLPKIGKACPICMIPNEDGGLCPRCYYHPPAFNKMICPYLYQSPLPHFIQQLKFSSQLIYARLLGELLLQAVKNQPQPSSLPECLIAMPLHPSRTRERGFNQSIEIARILSRQLKIPTDHHDVARIKATLPQTKILRAQRRANVKNAFTITGPLPKHVAIIEDVVTTGATVESLAKSLKRNGIEYVEVWCCARTVLH